MWAKTRRGIEKPYPPPHIVSIANLVAWVLKTACARESHDGWLEGGFWKLVSAAVMAVIPQNP
jgi:hypothetical protein